MWLISTIPTYLQVVEIILGIVAGLAGLLGIGALAYFIVRRSKITGEDQLAQSAVTSLTGELAAQKNENDRQGREIEHLHELLEQQRAITDQLEKKSETQAARINELTELITGSEKIDALTDASMAAFKHLGVPLAILQGGKAS